MKRRFLSVLLALAMCLTLLPTATLADESWSSDFPRGNWIGQTEFDSSKNYKLDKDTTLNIGVKFDIKKSYTGDPIVVTIDLNGHVLTAATGATVIAVKPSLTLKLIDSDPTAVHYFTEGTDGRWSLCPSAEHTHDATCREVKGGCIVGAGDIACVSSEGNDASIIMEGGNIIGGKLDYGSYYVGGVQSQNFTMTGGSIQGCVGSGVRIGYGGQITLGGDSNKTVTIANNEGNDILLINASQKLPAAKLTVGDMAAGSQFTVTRGTDITTDKTMPYVGDLDLTSNPLPTTFPDGVSWDASNNELTLTDVVCGTIKLPTDAPEDTTIKGSGYVELIRSVGSTSGKLIFDDADLEVGSIMWHDANGDDSHAVVLQNDSHLTVSGENGMYIGCLRIEDTSELKLEGSKIMSLIEDRINDLKDYLEDGTGYAAVKPEDPQQGVDYTLTKNGSPVTDETFRHYCTVKFYPGNDFGPGKFVGDDADKTEMSLRVPYGSTVTAPEVTPKDPDSYKFTGWTGKGTTNGQVLSTKVQITDEIEYDLVEFTAKIENFAYERFGYTIKIVQGGSVSPRPIPTPFELEVIYNGDTPNDAAAVSGNTTELNDATVFNNGEAKLTSRLTFRGLSAQLSHKSSTFPCFVKQKAVTADGWTTAPEIWALIYDTQIEQNKNASPVEGDSGDAPNSQPIARAGDDTERTGDGGSSGDVSEGGNDPVLKIYPAELVDGTYRIKANAEPIGRTEMYFTNTYTAYTVTFDSRDGTTVDPQIVAGGKAATKPTDPTKTGYDFDGWYTDAACTSAYDFSTPVTADLTLYARWTQPTYDVKWDAGYTGGTVDTAGATTSGTAGTKITKPTNAPSRAADANFVYAFAGWYTAAEGGDALTSSSTIPQSDVTYYAHWDKTPIYTVSFDSQGGSDVDPQKVVSGNKATEPTAEPTKSGYIFDGWYTDTSFKTAYDFETTVTGNLTLYARWTSTSSGTRYTIKASAGEGGSITPSGNVSVRRGADRSFTITPATGYAVRSVLVDGKDAGALTSYSFKNVRANHTISVTFQCNLPTGLNYLDHTAYVQGYPDGTVLPNGNITRAETAMMLYRLLTAERRAEIETSNCDFTDVSADAWYRTAAATMAAGGYLEGYADGSFGGDRSITRAEFIAALVRFLGVRDVTCSFSDVPTSHWAYAYIATATDAGWITGDNGTFRPDEAITRAEAMAIINRALCRGVDAESELLTFRSYPDNVSGAWYYYEVLEATNGHTYTGARPSEDWTRLF